MNAKVLGDRSLNTPQSHGKAPTRTKPRSPTTRSGKLRPRRNLKAAKDIYTVHGHAGHKGPNGKGTKVSDSGSQGLLTALHPKHIDELLSIWKNDKRTPTVESRRAWALARQIKPDVLHRWWHTRKALAAKGDIELPQGTYELPVGTPPVILVKEEPFEPVLTPNPDFLAKIPSSDFDITHPETSDGLVDSSPTRTRAYRSSLPSPSSASVHLSSPRISAAEDDRGGQIIRAYTHFPFQNTAQVPGSPVGVLGNYSYPLSLTTQHDLDLQIDLLLGPPIHPPLAREELMHDSATTCSAFICIGPNSYAHDGSYIGRCSVNFNNPGKEEGSAVKED